jgi:hypothetical protein
VNNTDGVLVIDEQSLKVQCNGDILTVDSPFAEDIHIYSTAGKLLYLQPKLPGKANFHINHLAKGVLFIHGSRMDEKNTTPIIQNKGNPKWGSFFYPITVAKTYP